MPDLTPAELLACCERVERRAREEADSWRPPEHEGDHRDMLVLARACRAALARTGREDQEEASDWWSGYGASLRDAQRAMLRAAKEARDA